MHMFRIGDNELLSNGFVVTMPPIPLAQETQNLISSLDGRQKHIYEVQIPALRQCTGPLSLQQKLAEELKDAIDAHSRQTEVSSLSSLTGGCYFDVVSIH